MKKHFYLLVIFVSSIVSCSKDFLDTPPTSNPTTQLYVTDIKTSREFLNGLYIDLSQNFFHGYYTVYPELIADNVKTNGGSNTFGSHYNWSQVANEIRVASGGSSTAANVNGYWTIGFKIIRGCNLILENIDKYSTGNPSEAADIKAQALALRGMINFYLVNFFAQPYQFSTNGDHPGIPLTTSSDWTQKFSRNTVGQVYAGIIADLTNAIQIFPSAGSSKQVLTKNSAMGLLSRVYLYKGDFQSSKNFARVVISSTPIMTINYPDALFKGQSSEMLFQLPPSASALGAFNTSFNSIYYRTDVFVSSAGMTAALRESATDLRSAWLLNSGSIVRIVKYPTAIVSGISNANGSYFMPVIRSSEMYLNAAESYAKLGLGDSARFFVNAIKLRADATSSPITSTGAALVSAVLLERRKELSFEGHRMFDLLRNSQGVIRMDGPVNASQLSYPNDKAIAPIPKVDVGYYGLEQNKGY